MTDFIDQLDTTSKNSWLLFVDRLYEMQARIITFVEQVLFALRWPEPHVDAYSICQLWTQYKSEFKEHFQFLTNGKHNQWCDNAAECLVHCLDRTTNLYFEVIYYYHAYTENWTVHTETLTPNARHLASILRNEIINTIAGPLPVHNSNLKHTLIYNLAKQLFIWWPLACKTEIVCLDKHEFAQMKTSFAMITHPKLTQSKYTIYLDTHIVEYIFELLVNQLS